MIQDPGRNNGMGWLEASGLPRIIRSLKVTVQPEKLAIGLVGIFLTFVWGGALDWGNSLLSEEGIGRSAISDFIVAGNTDRPYEEPTGTNGIFEVWRLHEKGCVLHVLGSSVPGSSVADGTLLGAYVDTHADARPLQNVVSMGHGVWWLLRHHFVYFLLFTIGFLLIWSWCGGAICRMAALESARDEKIGMFEALGYSRDKLIGGFFLAPVVPIGFILIIALIMVIGGMVLRIPVFGDVVCGFLYGLAILGGFVIAILLVGLLIGGHLLWPAVAVEGSDAFDACQRGVMYPLSKPWKWALYTIIAVVYAAICWVLVNLFTYLALMITRGVVGFGTSPFGWWTRGTAEAPISKMALLWPFQGPNAMHAWPSFENLVWWECISAVLVGIWVLLTIGLIWSFLISFYFSTSTVIYTLLRRDVDEIDTSEVYLEADEAAPAFAASMATEAAAPTPSRPDSLEEPSSSGGGDEPGE